MGIIFQEEMMIFGKNREKPDTDPIGMNEEEILDIQKLPRKSEFGKGLLVGLLLSGILILTGVLFYFGTVGGYAGDAAQVLTQPQTLRKLRSVQSIIEEDCLGDTDPDMLEAYLFKGIAAGLDDPYAAYYTREEKAELEKENQGSYRGIGVVFTQYSSSDTEYLQDFSGMTSEEETEATEEFYRVVITGVYESSPAEKAGLKRGDCLAAVEETDVTGWSLDRVMEKINEAFAEHEEVSFRFIREKQTLQVRIREDEVPLAKVTGKLAGKGIGYIKIPEFDAVTPEQFREVVEELKAESEKEDGIALSALVLDVRDNPGGILESVTEMLDDLLDECVTLTSSNALGERERFESEDGRIFDGRLAVLTNGASASAAEVFAGVLQYYKAASVVGQTTYGKGTVQHTYTLFDGSAFKLTSEKYAIAGENEIDGIGIIPDQKVSEKDQTEDIETGTDDQENEDPVLERALDLLG